MSYVIKTDTGYLKGRSGDRTDNLQKARVFQRLCDVKNSANLLNGWYIKKPVKYKIIEIEIMEKQL